MKMYALLSLMTASWVGFSQEEQSDTPSLIGKYVASYCYDDYQTIELKSDSTFEYISSGGLFADQTSYGTWRIEENELHLDGSERPDPSLASSYKCHCDNLERTDSLQFRISSEYDPLFQIVCVVNQADSNLYFSSSDFDGHLSIPRIDSATHIEIRGGLWHTSLSIPMTDTCCSYEVTLTEKDRTVYFINQIWTFIPGKLYDPEMEIGVCGRWYDFEADKPYYLKEELIPFIRFFRYTNSWIRYGRF